MDVSFRMTSRTLAPTERPSEIIYQDVGAIMSYLNGKYYHEKHYLNRGFSDWFSLIYAELGGGL